MKDKTKVVPAERGVKLIHNPVMNKGTAFSTHEREVLALRGLLPPRILTQDQQAKRIYTNLEKKENDLEKYNYLISLQDRNENLFYYVVRHKLKEIMPIIYTPTVGRACQLFGHIYRRSRGLYLSYKDKGQVRDILMNWPHKDARVIVVTDGGRILGLGDLGVNGMGIPIGKLSLYTACAGIDPTKCLPISIDVGTNNEKLLNDELYLGHHHKRIEGEQFDELLDEFIAAVQEVFPNAVIQLEDFATRNAFTLLDKYKDSARIFDDDIQGTASVALAGLLSAIKINNSHLKDQKILFLGAGEAGIGIGDIIVAAMEEEGMAEYKAKLKTWFFDSKGLVCASRDDLAAHKQKYAHDYPFTDDFKKAIEELKPTAIIGVSGQGGKFTKEVIELMSKINDKPIIFALSNPTSKSECTAEEAYRHSNGKAIFASGSPFDPVNFQGRTIEPGQGNNVYIFPGIGLGLVYSNAAKVTDKMFLEAAKVVSSMVSKEQLEKGTVYPPMEEIRQVSAAIAEAITRIAVEEGLSNIMISDHLLDDIIDTMYIPFYKEYL